MNNNGKTPLLDIKYNVEYPVEILGYKEGEKKLTQTSLRRCQSGNRDAIG